MIRRKKEISRCFLVSFFVITIFLSNIYFFGIFNINQKDKNSNITKEDILDDINLSSNLNLSDPITGSGFNQTVRIYVNNVSNNLNDNQESFEIPSLSSEEMVLTYGNFTFNFQNNYTTDYIIEDNDALFVNNYIAFNYSTTTSNWTLDPDTDLKENDFSQIIDNNDETCAVLNATKGILNFTISANFTNTKAVAGASENVIFNRSNILSLISSLVISLDANANLTVSVYNSFQSIWVNVTSGLSFNSSLNTQELEDHIINQNLNFIDLSNITQIQFIFERDDHTPFEASVYEYNLQSTFAFDLPITNESYVALEFDLKGNNCTVNGFNVWIRTLNISEAANTSINITLYRANTTIVRDTINLQDNTLRPDDTPPIDTIIINSYIDDNYTNFNFNTSKTDKLNVSNYFIVIKSNNSKVVYSLVGLPWISYGDSETEHQLKRTNDDGNTWVNAKKIIDTQTGQYTSGQLDASLFKLNVTRGYMPSDFNISGNYNLTIQNLPLVDLEDSSYPYNETSYLTWGIGQWANNFTIPISDEGYNNFTIDLSWDKTNIKGFKFNLSSYSVNAYWIEPALSSYSALYNENPEWIFNYTRDIYNPEFNNWSFYEFWYVYPDYFTAQNLTNPNNQEIYWRLNGQTNLTGNPKYNKVVVNSSFANINGTYSLNLTSYNFINQMYSYINYNATLWETNGFMYGDNISIALKIQDHNSKAPINGNVTVTLFYPNGTQFQDTQLNSSDGIINGNTRFYDFDNRTILNLTKDLNIFGEYNLGYFWYNGSAIGCKTLKIYIDTYEAEINDFEYYSKINKNILDGKIEKVYQNYTVLVASVNKRAPIPDYFPINDANISAQFIYEIGDQQIPISIDTFKQSQNIINSNETVNCKISITNLYEILPVNVKINVKLVSYTNEEWIIAQNTTDNVSLELYGDPNDNYEFNVNIKIPELNASTYVWMGENSPIRLAGVQTLITVYIEDNEVGTYNSGHISLLSSKTSNNYDGYILGLKINEKTGSESLINDFERDECTYLPYTNSILLNIFDKNYLSSYTQYSKDFFLKLNSEFINTSINPETLIKGQTVNVSSILHTEFGIPLENKNISCQYYYLNSWIFLNSNYTNSNGYIEFLIDTQQIDFNDDLLIKLSWDGDIINGASKNISINVLHQSNQISISIDKNSDRIYQNRKETISITIHNIGDSTLRILQNISIDFNRSLSYSVVTIDYLELEKLLPGESTDLIVEVDINNINILNISTSVTAQNILTNKSITITEETSFEVYSAPFYDYFIEYFILIIGAIIAVVWIGAIMYAWRIKKRIETPIEEPIKKRPRKGKYVPVSELKKPTPPQIPPKELEEPKGDKEQKETDLDSLLEERGLTDKEKKD